MAEVIVVLAVWVFASAAIAIMKKIDQKTKHIRFGLYWSAFCSLCLWDGMNLGGQFFNDNGSVIPLVIEH